MLTYADVCCCRYEFVMRQVHMRMLMKRIKNQHVIACLTLWQVLYADVC
jgi:hypothetical protein